MQLNDFSNNNHNIERAIFDVKSGLPIVIRHQQTKLCFGCEFLSEDRFNLIINLRNQVIIVLSNKRATYLFGQNFNNQAVEIILSNPNYFDVLNLTFLNEKLDLSSYDYKLASNMTESLIELFKKQELLPLILLLDVSETENNTTLSKLSKSEIDNYLANYSLNLQLICRTNIKLKLAHDAEIVSFRAAPKEHYAVIINKSNADKNVPIVRIHSSCFTGDLLTSLSCDCGDQLHNAISYINKHGFGIVIYLQQEGRSIGLINKLRAYNLQAQGFDTVEANHILGFEDDERSFEGAISILKHLNISKIKLLSNNPRKASALKQHNIEVSEIIPHQTKITEHNSAYLSTKVNKLGHNIKL